ncbi:MAG: outer membrane beta-barrel protein, partial [Bacteroidota bacterium]
AEDVLRFSQFGFGIGSTSMALGGASAASVNDYSALFWNPAALAQLRNYEFSAGVSYLGYDNTTRFMGTRTEGSNSRLNLNSLGFVYPVPTVQGSLTFAFGFNRVSNYSSIAEYSGFNAASSIVPSLIPDVDLSTLSQAEEDELLANNIPYQIYLADISSNRLVTPVTGDVQQSATVREGGGANHWSFGGAIDVAKDFSLGASVNIVSGSYRYDREYVEEDVMNNYQRAPADTLGLFDRFSLLSTINSNLNGVNAVFGLHYRKQGKYKVGFTVRTPTYYTIEETFSDEARSRFDPNINGTVDQFDIAFDGKTEYKIVTPFVVTAGGAVYFRDWLMVAGDIEYTDWRTMSFSTSLSELEAENRLIQNIYRATLNLRGGIEVTLWDLGVKLRGGFSLTPSPYEGDPTDFDQQHYTAGAGFRLEENLWLNASYAFGNWKNFRDNYTYNGTAPSRTDEHIKTHTLGLTLSLQF